MKKLILSCSKATYLISLKEEGKLSFTQRMQLRAHTTVCSMCKLFERQTVFISANAMNLQNHRHYVLGEDKKEKISKALNEKISRP